MRITTKSLLGVLICALSVPCELPAELVVNWGGDYVNNDSQNLTGNVFLGAHMGNGYGGTPFSATTAFSPPISGAYSGTSARFYGGAILAHQGDPNTPDAFDNARIKNQGGNDSVQLKATRAGHLHNMHAIFLWNQPDFLTGNSPITFDASTTASMRIGQASTETVRDASLRLIVRDLSNDYWLSAHSFTGLANNHTYTWNSGNQGFGAGTDGQWTAYDPTSVLGSLGPGTDLHFDPTMATFVSKNFSGINGIGFFFDQDVYHNNLEFHMERFSVNTIPEPSGILLFGMASMIGLSRRVRRKNN